jgi:hypothetical protein
VTVSALAGASNWTCQLRADGITAATNSGFGGFGASATLLTGSLLLVGGTSSFGVNAGDGFALSATGGAATALPAQPLGYLIVQINGLSRKIPFYAA